MNHQETKVIITFKGDRAAVGIQQTDCDPVFFTKEGTLDDVLAAVPGFVVEAGQKWGVSRRNPKADLPAPPPPALAATLAKPVQTAAATAKPKVQTPMF